MFSIKNIISVSGVSGDSGDSGHSCDSSDSSDSKKLIVKKKYINKLYTPEIYYEPII